MIYFITMVIIIIIIIIIIIKKCAAYDSNACLGLDNSERIVYQITSDAFIKKN